VLRRARPGHLPEAPPAPGEEHRAFLYAFDLLELDGTDMRREPIEVRKATLASILRKSRPGVRLNAHLEHPEGNVVFFHACKLGAEGIVSKRLGSRYRSGRSPDWLKFKNPAEIGADAAKRATGPIKTRKLE
jgi:bifunctional non-homologous end joining protein LigD